MLTLLRALKDLLSQRVGRLVVRIHGAGHRNANSSSTNEMNTAPCTSAREQLESRSQEDELDDGGLLVQGCEEQSASRLGRQLLVPVGELGLLDGGAAADTFFQFSAGSSSLPVSSMTSASVAITHRSRAARAAAALARICMARVRAGLIAHATRACAAVAIARF